MLKVFRDKATGVESVEKKDALVVVDEASSDFSLDRKSDLVDERKEESASIRDSGISVQGGLGRHLGLFSTTFLM